MNELRVEVAENGFVVFEACVDSPGMRGKTWVFETPGSLGEFMRDWGDRNTKIKSEPGKSPEI